MPERNLLKSKELFIQALINYYNLEEINSFFYYFCDYTLGLSKIDLALNRQYALSKSQQQILDDATNRLQNFEPIQYIYGVSHFFNLDFKVTKDVLIPRPETEELVQMIIKNHQEKENKILDIGTGSGCISISLAKNLPNSNVSALDISKKALKIARENAKLNNVMVNFLLLDILKIYSLPEKYDVVISNPPYVGIEEKKQMKKNVLDFEPHLALFVSDENPLIFYQKIGELAFNHLNSNGILYFEINQNYGLETLNTLSKIGFQKIELQKDFLGNDRFIIARR